MALSFTNKIYLRMELISALKQIELCGDRDEASYKHILHGLTALYHRGSWRLGEDYSTPGRGCTIERIEPYWNRIVGIFNRIKRENFAELLRTTDYDCNYRLDLYY